MTRHHEELAYDVFRNGCTKDKPPAWDNLEPWMRDAMTVTYLQGKLDGRDKSQTTKGHDKDMLIAGFEADLTAARAEIERLTIYNGWAVTEIERLRAAGQVLVRRAESVIITDRAGNRFQKVFVVDLEALRAALEPRP